MLDRDDPRFLDFRERIEDALLELVRVYEPTEGTEAAIERAIADVHRISWVPGVAEESALPEFDRFGWLPATWQCPWTAFADRFEDGSRRRRRLTEELYEVVKLAATLTGARLVVGGSFVTAEPEPRDLDAALLVPAFGELLANADPRAVDLWRRAESGQDVQMYVERDERQWWGWFRLFQQTRDADHLYRGVVEVVLHDQ